MEAERDEEDDNDTAETSSTKEHWTAHVDHSRQRMEGFHAYVNLIPSKKMTDDEDLDLGSLFTVRGPVGPARIFR